MKQSKFFNARCLYICNNAIFGSLSIARVFGGFPKLFFTTYHDYFPKAEPVSQYDLRMELYELFHYLNHTLIFGVSSVIPS